MSKHTADKKPDNDPSHKPNFLQLVISTLGAAIGVQSSKTQERDFKHGSIGTFIAAGVIFTVLFVAVVATIVSRVLESSGL